MLLLLLKVKNSSITKTYNDSDQISPVRENMDKKLDNIIKQSPIKVLDGRFAVVQMAKKNRAKDFFAMMVDDEEKTLVIEEHALKKNRKITGRQGWYKLVQVQVSVPFFAVGFLAAITNAIAKKGINVLVISTFSFDYLLIAEEDILAAVASLQEIGFTLKK